MTITRFGSTSSGTGERGPRGFPGTGIEDITFDDNNDGSVTINITMTDATTYGPFTGTLVSDNIIALNKLSLTGTSEGEKLIVKNSGGNTIFQVNTINNTTTMVNATINGVLSALAGATFGPSEVYGHNIDDSTNLLTIRNTNPVNNADRETVLNFQDAINSRSLKLNNTGQFTTDATLLPVGSSVNLGSAGARFAQIHGQRLFIAGNTADTPSLSVTYSSDNLDSLVLIENTHAVSSNVAAGINFKNTSASARFYLINIGFLMTGASLVPTADNSFDLGSFAFDFYWRDLSISRNIRSKTAMGIFCGANEVMNFANGQITTRRNIIPSADDIDLGTADNPFNEIFANVLNLNGLSSNNATITNTLTTTSVRLADGTLAAPSLTFQSSPDTGFFITAGNDIRVALDGVLAWRFTSQNTICHSHLIPSLTADNRDLGGSSNFWNNVFATRFRAASSGAWGPRFTFNSDIDTGMYSQVADTLGFATGGEPRLLISAGECKFYNNIVPEVDNSKSIGNGSFAFDDVSAYGFTTISDANKKEEIEDADLGLEFINQLRPVSYKYIGGRSGRKHYGLIAQEVEDVLVDNLISTTNFAPLIKHPKVDVDDEVIPDEFDYALRYTEFIAPMIKAIKELKLMVETLQTQLDDLLNN